jgi:hypothetical protein
MEIKPQKPRVFHLTKKDIDLVKSLGTFFTYTADATLFYEDQVPLVAYVLIDGDLLLTRSRRKSIPISKNSVLGISEVLNSIPSLYAAKIKEGSKVFFLDKSSILELLTYSDQIDGELSESLSSLEVA